MSSKKRPFLQRIITSLLMAIEKRAPYLARSLRYHSEIVNPSHVEMHVIFSRHTRWADNRYASQLSLLVTPRETENSIVNKAEAIPLSVLRTDDYIIHGHIKAPIQKSTGRAYSYLPISRLSLTDSYPLPIFRTRVVTGTVIFIPNIENYFHLMVDYLLPPVCAIIREPERYSHVKFLLQRDFPMVALFSTLLSDMGLSTSLVSIGKFDRIVGGTLLIGGAEPRDSGAAFAYPDEIRQLAHYVDRHIEGMVTPKRIFITRSGAQRRRLLNEAALRQVLTKFNIESVELGFQNPLEQIALFRNAELIISVHGAALSNLIWARHAHVVELFPANLRPTHYLNIASQMDLPYDAIIGSDADGREDFTIDVDEIERLLTTKVTA